MEGINQNVICSASEDLSLYSHFDSSSPLANMITYT